MANAALTCLVSTSPNPLTIGSSGPSPELSRITVLVTNRSAKTFFCNRLKFRLSEGSGGGDLTENLKDVKYTPVDNGAWDMRRVLENDKYVFIAIPRNGETIPIGKNSSFLFEFSEIAVNKTVGVTALVMNEWPSENPSDPGTNSVPIGKYPTGFRFGDLHLVNPTTGKVTGQVEKGDRVDLIWNATKGARYWLSWDGKPEIEVTDQRRYPDPGQDQPPLLPVKDTTYTLRAQFDAGGEPVEHFLTTTIVVRHPDVSASNLTATTTSLLQPGEMIVGYAGTGVFPLYHWKYDGPSTDGFVCGRLTLVDGMPLGEHVNLFCGCDGSADPYGITIHGTNTSSMQPNGTTYDSFLAPVQRGTKFTVAIRPSLDPSNVKYDITFTWIPLGQNTAQPIRISEDRWDIKWDGTKNAWVPLLPRIWPRPNSNPSGSHDGVLR